MEIRQLPRGDQLSVKGNIINVPCDVQYTIDTLPRNMAQSDTVQVILKTSI